MALTRKELDVTTCATPGCDHSAHSGLVLSGRCHVGAPSKVEYQSGVLYVSCAICETPVVEIAVQAEAITGEGETRH